jgi:putative effector of murein hydrolase
MIFLLIAVFICIILYEVPELIRNKYWRELTVVSFLISIAFMISLMQILKIEIPNPVRDTQYLVKDLLNLGYE